MIPDGTIIMYGGSLGYGSAHRIIEALAQKGTKGLTIVSNDCSMAVGPNGEEFYGVVKLVHDHQVKRVTATHMGMTPDVDTQGIVNETLIVDLIPQGTLVGMIRTGGAGLGGVFTPAGVGTTVEDSPLRPGKQTVDDRDYLLVKPIRADFAFINDYFVDKFGGIWYKGTTRNFNIIMAITAGVAIAEADSVVEIDDIQSENVVASGTFVNYIVGGGSA